ncbi:hypothetical protein RvY_08257 [Ramazzottius varieornatus]|uniref:separase n=1 Tax=Ramazzottius varieornatus TaxID=947166 RepID=A0A1D1V590_RAMVA|nr:hypothetical protein RvY_08257 [Ramazzottius varieornatus]
MQAFSDAVALFSTHGFGHGDSFQAINGAFDRELPIKNEQDAQWVQKKLLVVLQACSRLAKNRPEDDEDGFANILELVERSILATQKTLLHGFSIYEKSKVMTLQFLFQIARACVKKNEPTRILRITTLMYMLIREQFDEAEQQGLKVQKDIIDVSEGMYIQLYNWGLEHLQEDSVNGRYSDILQVFLESIPFKNMIAGLGSSTSLWQDKLCSIVRNVSRVSQPEVSPVDLVDKVVKVLKKCQNVTVEDAIAISTEFSTDMAGSVEMEGFIVAVAGRWKEYLMNDSSLNVYSSYVSSIIKARMLFSFHLDNHYIVSKGVETLVARNKAARKVIYDRARREENTEPVKLDFNDEGSTKVDPPSTTLVQEMISLKEEKILLQPLFDAAKCLEEAFQSFGSIIQEPDYVRIVEEAVTTIIELAVKFQLHRLSYWALLASQLAWKIVAATDNISKAKIFAVAAVYMRSLRDLRLFDPGAVLLERVSDRAGQSRQECLFEYGQFVSESFWLLIFSQKQVDASLDALSTLKSILDLGVLEANFSRLLKAQYFRCLAYAFTREPKAVLERTGISSSTSPLSILEQARADLISFVQLPSDAPLWTRLTAKLLYLTLSHDLAQFLMWIGGPTEAQQFVATGQNRAQYEVSCRWELVFMVLNAKCQQNKLRSTEFRSTLKNVEDVLVGRRRPLLADMLRRAKKTPTTATKGRSKPRKNQPVSDMDALSAAASKMSITHQSDFDFEPGSEEPEDQSDMMGTNQLIKMEFFSHKNDCQCDSCVDYDVHAIFFETAHLRLRSDDNPESKGSIFKQCSQLYAGADGPSLQTKMNAVYKLAKKGVIKVSGEHMLKVFSLIHAPMTRIRLRNVANGFQSFKASPQTLPDIVRQMVASFPEFEVIHPDITYFAKYLTALNIIVQEMGSRKELQALVSSMWAPPAEEVLASSSSTSSSTKVLPSTPHDTLRKKIPANGYMTPRPTTPEKMPPPKMEPNIKKGLDSKETRSRRGKNDAEPEVPSDMTQEINQQPKVLAKRRQTMLLENLQPMNDEEIQELADKSIVESSDSGLSDGMKEAIRILSDGLEGMSAFPIYPSHKLMSILLLMLIGQREGQKKLAHLANSCTLGKFHHLALMYYNRVLTHGESDVWTPGSKALEKRVAHLSFDVPRELVTENLPVNWVVCTINCATNHTFPIHAPKDSRILHIVVTRWEAGVEPITIYLPVPDHYHSMVLHSLSDILDRGLKNQTSYKDARDYWQVRTNLNVELCDMTHAMDGLLGCAKGLLLTSPVDAAHQKTLRDRVRSLKKVVAEFSLSVGENILRILVMSGLVMKPQQLLSLASKLLNRPERSAVVVKVAAYLNRNPLVDINDVTCARNPLILVLDNDTYGLPWESITTLRSQPVSRLPSIQFANILLAEYKEELLRRDKVFYIVNPGMDLANTEKSFVEFRQRKAKNKTWNGVVGKAPSAKDIKTAFEEHELVYYCGHGCGQQFFNMSIFDSRFSSANMILSGCSSVKLDHTPAMDASGFVQQCLIMGSPCVIGCLWSVTSGCIDKYMMSILDKLFEDEVEKKRRGAGGDAAIRKCLLELIAVSRDAVGISTYLVGAAPVLIGLPISY